MSQTNNQIVDDALEYHKTELKRALKFLPSTYDSRILCRLLRTIYDEDNARKLAFERFKRPGVRINEDLDEFFTQSEPFPPHHEKLFNHYLDNLYQEAETLGYIPKGVKKDPDGSTKKTKRQRDKEEKSRAALEVSLHKNREKDLSEDEKSYLDRTIINLDGALYFRDYILKEDIPDNPEELKKDLEKIADCEIHALEGIEFVTERPGRETNELEFRYKVKLKSPSRVVVTEVGADELTKLTNFSRFLVSKGYPPFTGNRKYFEMVQNFLIKEQDYPIVRTLSCWGEIRTGIFLFENGIYDTKQQKFYVADQEYRIDYKGRMFVCPSGSEQVKPPVYRPANETTKEDLARLFYLWERFNGMVNIRTAVCYAICCVFSSHIKKKYDGFPLLFMFGERGTGKSTSMDWFMSLFGYQNGNRQSVSKSNTLKSVIRRMSIPKSFPFFLDDYRHHESNREAPDLTSPILNWFHRIGTGMAKKSQDNRTIDTPMNACVVMTGNDKPTDPATLDRLLILNYTKYLNKEEQAQINLVADNVQRFPEFLSILLDNYDPVREALFGSIKHFFNRLGEEGFKARTCFKWSLILAAHDTFSYFFPQLDRWIETQEEFYYAVVRSIRKEQALQNGNAPLLTFFSAMDFYAAEVTRGANDEKVHVLDHRHFTIKRDVLMNQNDNNGSLMPKDVLAIHLNRIWKTLQSKQAEVTREIKYPVLESTLQNSRFFVAKSQQTLLTREIGSQVKGNYRCIYLDLAKLKETGQLSQVIEYAEEYEEMKL